MSVTQVKRGDSFLQIALFTDNGAYHGVVVFEEAVCLRRSSRFDNELGGQLAILTRFAHRGGQCRGKSHV